MNLLVVFGSGHEQLLLSFMNRCSIYNCIWLSHLSSYLQIIKIYKLSPNKYSVTENQIIKYFLTVKSPSQFITQKYQIRKSTCQISLYLIVRCAELLWWTLIARCTSGCVIMRSWSMDEDHGWWKLYHWHLLYDMINYILNINQQW